MRGRFLLVILLDLATLPAVLRHHSMLIAFVTAVCGCASDPIVQPEHQPTEVVTQPPSSDAAICEVHVEPLIRRSGTVQIPVDGERRAQAEFFPNDGVKFCHPGEAVQAIGFYREVCPECVRARIAFLEQHPEASAISPNTR